MNHPFYQALLAREHRFYSDLSSGKPSKSGRARTGIVEWDSSGMVLSRGGDLAGWLPAVGMSVFTSELLCGLDQQSLSQIMSANGRMTFPNLTLWGDEDGLEVEIVIVSAGGNELFCLVCVENECAKANLTQALQNCRSLRACEEVVAHFSERANALREEIQTQVRIDDEIPQSVRVHELWRCESVIETYRGKIEALNVRDR